MTPQLPVVVRVIRDYQAPYTDPIQICAGDEVTFDLQKETDIPGWVWCTSRDGRSGWVPNSYLEIQGVKAISRKDYNAFELTVTAGDQLTIHALESCFYWASDINGNHGWVPISCVEMSSAEQDAE